MNGDVFSLPSVDYEKSYTFYVRSKINKFCGRTQFWSEWSVPVIWGSNSTKGTVEEQLYWFGIRTVLVPIASCLLLLVLVILLVRMERVWVILMPRIPNPSKNFDELFITHNGNFQVRWCRQPCPELTLAAGGWGWAAWRLLSPCSAPWRNGLESPKMLWRASSPTTVRISAM